ncbi:glycoside hydrolase family 5 protein [Novosphingobium mangrovi (ex Huang et al. 2023)]|uniref:glycoside hydrolase family 5 protein n=1 Tax=Novosphingobium mangrovi (ex Huang et al. 2023) TaxID=2976432 RepID=UPI0021A7EA2B|nr:glycoside hydrolase family 5 protein [Novosphingobium mangrovi (ex Huang et al. 2023)]
MSSTPTSTPTPTPTATPTPTPTPTPTQSFPYTPIAALTASVGPRLPLGKCVNMGNQLEAPNEGDLGRKIADSDFPFIKAGGFDTVRIPIRFSGHAATTAPYTIDSAFMSRVQHVVTTATNAGLNVIIDMHHYDEMNDDPTGQLDRFVSMWRQIATTFRNAPDTVWFELLNEPKNVLTNSNLLNFYNPALSAIRETNVTRSVIIGGGLTSNIQSLATLKMPNDPYVVPTFHYYDPFEFTHQGATFITPTPPVGVTFGSDTDYANLSADLNLVTDYYTRTGRVPFIGEYGAYEDIPLDQRATYYGAVSHAFASIGIQSCAWSYVNTFQLRDSSGWITEITDLIATTTTK